MRSPDRLALRARANRQEIIRSGLTRRDLGKLGLLTSAGYLVAKRGLSSRAEAQTLTSPPTRPFVVPLPIPPTKAPIASLSPAPQADPLPGEGRPRPHQAWSRFPPRRLYQVHQRQFQHSFHPDLPLNTVWGFDGRLPGPTFRARYGVPMLVRQVNDLPQDHRGFGIPQVSTHLHNGHTPSESDGFPGDFFPKIIGGPERFYDHHYPNALPGFSGAFAPNGDRREPLGTAWYHDHRAEFTAQNVYRGLYGFYLHFNDLDTGNETTGFRLPSGRYDVPMAFADRLFDGDGQLYYDLFAFDGILGDKITVNGRIQPYFAVNRRRYRFRWLNTGPSRIYEFFLTDPANLSRVIPFTLIANDGNLLPASVTVNSIRIAPGERVDVVVDFSDAPEGTSLLVENRLSQPNPRHGGTLVAAGAGDAVLRLDIRAAATDASLAPPYTFYPSSRPAQDEIDRAVTRTWSFDLRNGQWVVNDRVFDPETVAATPIEGTSETWIFQNLSGAWHHPIHMHLEEFHILTRNGTAPPPIERGRKDVVRLRPYETVRAFIRFRDFLGPYPLHCHNIVHEDHGMMVRWDVGRV